MTTFYQAGLILGMLQGVYDGDVSFKTVAEHGDTGLGTLNGVDGEMIAVDGTFYRVDVNGVASVIGDSALTPFSVVAKFQPTIAVPVEHIATIQDLNAVLDKHLPTKNIFYMIRIEGQFAWLSVRSESCQTGSRKPLAETLPKLQKTYELKNMAGSVVPTCPPSYSAGFTIPGYHHHFIDQARTTGGHVFDLRLTSGKVMITPLRSFNLVLFNS